MIGRDVNKMKIFIKGLNSCVLRRQKLEQYKQYLVANNHSIVLTPGESDYIILWTCAFRADVRNNSYKEVLRYQKEYLAKVLIAGCLPDIDPGSLSIFPKENIIPWKTDTKLEQIFGNAKPLTSFSIVYVEKALCKNAAEFRKINPDKDIIFHDQFIKLVISEGCNFNCVYCSEKLAFPSHKSIPIGDLFESLKETIKKTGKNNVVLHADSLGDYGSDINTSLPKLIHELSKLKVHFALNFLNPASFIKHWWELLQLIEKGTIIHLNLPIQSASDSILKAMNRAYTKNDINFIFYSLNKLKVSFDTHILIGFPGETDEDFNETVDFLLYYKPSYVLASSFMEMPLMPAAKLQEKISVQVVKERLVKLSQQLATRGIICNTDGSQLMLDRLRKLNKN
jgi:tRNA A37 methylthiotransferase MiaB